MVDLVYYGCCMQSEACIKEVNRKYRAILFSHYRVAALNADNDQKLTIFDIKSAQFNDYGQLAHIERAHTLLD
jgi:hypothetical protein